MRRAPEKGWGGWEGEEDVGMKESGQTPASERQGGAAGGWSEGLPHRQGLLWV